MNELIQLLTQFDMTTILIFIILIALSAKGIITFFDWVKERIMKMFNKQSKKEKELEQKVASIVSTYAAVGTHTGNTVAAILDAVIPG